MMEQTNNQVDPITTQVIRNGLIAAAKEMQLTMKKTAFNPLLYEMQDFGVGLINAEGESLAQGTSIPTFLACLPAVIQNGLKKFGPDRLQPGDIILANDPYTTGTHISDTAVYMPIFHGGELQGFAINMAHWADVGGKTPGGWCPDSIDVFQEGMLFPYIKLYEAGVVNQALMDFIMANNRFPDVVRGDLAAQIASCRTGIKRYVALCDKYGAGTVREAMAIVFDQSEKLVRHKISQIPKGTWSAENFLDHDGVIKDLPRKIKVTVRIEGDEVTVDFTGTSETAAGPINVPLPGTVACVEHAFRSIVAPFDPPNAGHLRPLRVIAPEHTLTNPSLPAPCDSYGYAQYTAMDLVNECLSNAVPDRCPAGGHMLCGLYFYRVDPSRGEPFILFDDFRGGGGALPRDDGADATIFWDGGDAPLIPVEVIESRFPIRIERHELHGEEYGPGKYRGGLGVIRDYRILTDNVLLQTFNEQTLFPSHGLFGGCDGGITQVVARPGTDEEEVLPARISFYGPLHSGDVVRGYAAGGAGYGDPLERDPERVRYEVLNELLSPDKARELYGVIIATDSNGDPIVDSEATEAYRSERRRAKESIQ